jgi:hypothetical protein
MIGRVRVRTSNMLVRCVAIERSAVIKIQGRSDYQDCSCSAQTGELARALRRRRAS